MTKKHKETRRYKITQGYFRGVLAYERQIQALESEIEVQQSRLFLNGVPGGEVVTKTTEGDSLEKGYILLRELCDRLDTELIGYTEEREKAFEVLGYLSDGPSFDVVYYRYFRGYSFKDIARLLEYSEDHIYDLHRRAMYKVYPYLPIEYRQN